VFTKDTKEFEIGIVLRFTRKLVQMLVERTKKEEGLGEVAPDGLDQEQPHP
jgi:hypothetical protein